MPVAAAAAVLLEGLQLRLTERERASSCPAELHQVLLLLLLLLRHLLEVLR